MKQKFVYDLPMRVFHWLFALLFVAAFAIGKTVDDDSLVFSYHMLGGIVLCFLVVLRVLWGIFGTKYSRFSGFALQPNELALYLKGVVAGEKRKWLGHNPASSWAAIAMMAFALGLGITGYLMTTGQCSEDLEEVHELLANGFFIIVLFHLAGVAIHTLRHKDAIWKSMFTGWKSDIPEESTPVRSHSVIGILFLLTTLWFSTYLAQNFDSSTASLSIFGSKFHLGEAEENENKSKRGENVRENT
ncbi:MAG: cytochrome b/b6 domain-containing protein [Deltaproteobacteria bacterium]|nr:cytochrome b/b6 domain-containing protein [Deltaproteobacteria bacterium]